jgi:hypothetical protein
MLACGRPAVCHLIVQQTVGTELTVRAWVGLGNLLDGARSCVGFVEVEFSIAGPYGATVGGFIMVRGPSVPYRQSNRRDVRPVERHQLRWAPELVTCASPRVWRSSPQSTYRPGPRRYRYQAMVLAARPTR